MVFSIGTSKLKRESRYRLKYRSYPHTDSLKPMTKNEQKEVRDVAEYNKSLSEYMKEWREKQRAKK